MSCGGSGFARLDKQLLVELIDDGILLGADLGQAELIFLLLFSQPRIVILWHRWMCDTLQVSVEVVFVHLLPTAAVYQCVITTRSILLTIIGHIASSIAVAGR